MIMKLSIAALIIMALGMAGHAMAVCNSDNCRAGRGVCVGDVCQCVFGNGGRGCHACHTGCDGTCTGAGPRRCKACAPSCSLPKTCISYLIFEPTLQADVGCSCDPGLTGTSCDQCADDENGCHGHGTCNSGTCQCDDGYEGTFCESENGTSSTTSSITSSTPTVTKPVTTPITKPVTATVTTPIKTPVTMVTDTVTTPVTATVQTPVTANVTTPGTWSITTIVTGCGGTFRTSWAGTLLILISSWMSTET